MPMPILNKKLKTQFVRDLKDKDQVQNPFLVKTSSVGLDKNSKPFMNLILMDKTGEVEARVWDDLSRHGGQVNADAFIWVEGKVQLYQGRRQVVVKSIQILREDEVELNEFLVEARLNAETLYKELLQFVHSMKDPFYKALAESVLIDDAEIVSKIKRAPAAKSVHHAYPVGLLEHMLSVTGLLDKISSHYGSFLDRDLMFLGGFFHDIGKIWELSYDRVVDYTDEGKLIGHLVMGVELVERKINSLEAQVGRLPGAFPLEKRLLIKHVILAHHGQYEYGSPKRPKCLEALLVHYVDDLDSKVNSIRMFVEKDESASRWTGLNKQYERYFYKSDSLVGHK